MLVLPRSRFLNVTIVSRVHFREFRLAEWQNGNCHPWQNLAKLKFAFFLVLVIYARKKHDNKLLCTKTWRVAWRVSAGYLRYFLESGRCSVVTTFKTRIGVQRLWRPSVRWQNSNCTVTSRTTTPVSSANNTISHLLPSTYISKSQSHPHTQHHPTSETDSDQP